VKYPLDRICVKSGILCPRCQKLVDSGIVNEYEIPVMKHLIELEETKYKELRQGQYHKAYKSNDIMVIVVEGIGNSKVLDKASKELSHSLGLRVKIVEKTSDLRRLIEQIISPATLLGVNTLWLPDGSELMVVRVSKRDQRIIGAKQHDYEKIIKQIVGRQVRIRYE